MLFPKPFPMEGAEPTGSPAPAPAGTPPAPAPAPAAPLPPEVAQKELAEARKESASYRERLRAAEAETAKLKADAEERAKKEAEAKGEYQKLYEDAKPKLSRLEALEQNLKRQAEAELAAIPENLRGFAPADPEKAIEYARTIRAQPGAPAAAPAAPPAPAAATTAPAAAPTATAGGPPKPTAAEMQEYGYTRDQKKKAELGAKIRAWDTHARAHPGES
jgi:hypothetical protein